MCHSVWSLVVLRNVCSYFLKCNTKRGLIYTENKHLDRRCRSCNPFSYEFGVDSSVNKFKLICCIAILHIPRTPMKEGWPCSALQDKGVGGLCFVLWCKLSKVCCTGCPSRGLLSCNPRSISAAAIQYLITWCLLIISSQGMHGLQGQYSWVAMASSVLEFLNNL